MVRPGKNTSRIVPSDAANQSFFSPAFSPFSGGSGPSPERGGDSYVPPWTEPYVIGVAGFSGSGKTSISQQIIRQLNQPWTVLMSFDNFYKPLTAHESQQAYANDYDFDTPAAIDMDLVVEKLTALKRGHKTEIPVYSFSTHSRTDKTLTIYGANVIIVEGIYALYDPRLLALMDIKVFVDTDLDVCLARRLTRDIVSRGRDLPGALRQWERFVKPNATASVYPTLRNADLVLPRGLDNTRAIDIMIQHISKQLALKSARHLERLRALGHGVDVDVAALANVSILPSTSHTAGIHSVLFAAATGRTDFIFYFDRIAHLLVERALDTLTNYAPVAVACHNGHTYRGLVQSSAVVAVSIIRSGDCFMNCIKKTFPAISIGKLLIQSDSLTGEPQLHMEALPQVAHNAKYFLFDAQAISGAGAIMAIQVLLDHSVAQENIVMITYLSTEIAVKRILNVFPRVTVVVGKLSNMSQPNPSYNREGFMDTDWPFRGRWIDSLYFGTE